MATRKIVQLAGGGYEFPAHPFRGVDLREDPRWIQPGSLLQSQNFIPYQGYVAVKRKGSEILNATAWASVNRGVFGMRYYVNSSTRYKLACLNVTAGDQVVSINDTTGAVTLLTGMPPLAGDSRGPIGSIRYEDTIQWTSRSAFPYRIRGFTLDSAGVGVGNAVVQLFRTSDDVLLQETVSIGPSGQYDVGVRDTTTEHYLVAYRASPDIMGTTINTLTGS